MSKKIAEKIKKGRHFLKANHWGKKVESDQQKGKPVPEVQKPYPDDSKFVDLVPVEKISAGQEEFTVYVAVTGKVK
ncbi:MAG: hypothetical protein ACOC4G_13545 [Bacillota bacterium]